MKVKISVFLFTLLLFSLIQMPLYGGTTGKITGIIADAGNGESLAGANITIEGTSMGAASDIDGNYFILNIPPGIYIVSISMIGYKQVQFENVQVGVDLTTRINAALQTTVLDLGETVVVTAERNLVIKDMTSSFSTMGADQIESLPVQQVQEVLRLNAGIIESDGRLHIRGGRAGEVAYWVDGISATDIYDGRMGVQIENSAVQELQVISGTFNAEYGQAMSGIVNIITKEGSRKYSGEIEVYGGDYVSGSDKFSLYKNLVTEEDENTGLTRIVSGEKDYPLKKFNPIFNAELSLSGPVPFLGDKLTFFTNGRYFYDEGYFYGRNWFRPTGAPGDNSLVAMNPNSTSSFQGKVTYHLNPAIKMSYNLFWNYSRRERNYYRINSVDYQFNPLGQANFQQFGSQGYKYNPYGLPQTEGEAYTHTFLFNHVLSPASFYELRVSRYDTKSKQYVFKDPTTSVRWLVIIQEDPDLGIKADTLNPYKEEDQAILQSIIAQGGKYEYVPDPNGPDGYILPDEINAPTAYSYMNKGMDVTHVRRKTEYWVAKFDFTSQINKTNQFKFGSEVRLHELELHGFQIVPKTDASGTVIDPFQPAVPEVGSIYRHDYNRKPREISAYVQDKIEYNYIILNVGLRYDYFDANSVVPEDSADPNIYAPFKEEHIYKNYSPDLPEDELIEYTPDERRSFMHKEVDAKMSLSPRLGMAFPITDRGVIHFSYGHFFQIPEFQYLYSNPDFKVTSGSGSSVMGNADLKPQKTVMYELGLQQQFTDDIGIDITLFYRDVRDWVGTSPEISTAKTGVTYSIFENKDYSNVRGITLKVEKRFSNHYSFRTDYTFQSAEGTYSNPQDAYNASLRNEAPVIALLPMNWDQRHTLNAQLIYSISDWTLSLIGRYWSGRPYTPSYARSETVGASAVTGFTTNSARRPNQKIIDLTIKRFFQLGSNLRFGFFVNVYNLFDQRDETNVYGDTGTAEYTTNADPSRIPYNSVRISTIEDYVLQPGWYTPPRQIQVGLMLGFN
jgi:hypothetical protein